MTTLDTTPEGAGRVANAGPSAGAFLNAMPIGELTFRPGRPEDAPICGRIAFEAFFAIASRHSFPADFPDVETAVGLFDFMLSQSNVNVVVALAGERIVGSNALWEQTPIAGIGPITVAPDIQNEAIGRRLMLDALERAESRGYLGVRLVQAAYHCRSLALYTKLGFDAREPLTVFQGAPVSHSDPDRRIRPARDDDIGACADLHERLHGFSRAGELPSAIAQGSAMVVERGGRISGYATQVGFFGHAVGEMDADVMALVGAARSFAGPGFLVPTRNAVLMRWCLANRLRVIQPMTLMSRGEYAEPRGAYLPSVLF